MPEKQCCDKCARWKAKEEPSTNLILYCENPHCNCHSTPLHKHCWEVDENWKSPCSVCGKPSPLQKEKSPEKKFIDTQFNLIQRNAELSVTPLFTPKQENECKHLEAYKKIEHTEGLSACECTECFKMVTEFDNTPTSKDEEWRDRFTYEFLTEIRSYKSVDFPEGRLLDFIQSEKSKSKQEGREQLVKISGEEYVQRFVEEERKRIVEYVEAEIESWKSGGRHRTNIASGAISALLAVKIHLTQTP